METLHIGYMCNILRLSEIIGEMVLVGSIRHQPGIELVCKLSNFSFKVTKILFLGPTVKFIFLNNCYSLAKWNMYNAIYYMILVIVWVTSNDCNVDIT